MRQSSCASYTSRSHGIRLAISHPSGVWMTQTRRLCVFFHVCKNERNIVTHQTEDRVCRKPCCRNGKPPGKSRTVIESFSRPTCTDRDRRFPMCCTGLIHKTRPYFANCLAKWWERLSGDSHRKKEKIIQSQQIDDGLARPEAFMDSTPPVSLVIST